MKPIPSSLIRVALAFVCLLCPARVGAQDGHWIDGVPGPSPRYGHVGAYDPVRQRLIVFGGATPNGASWATLNDVWALSATDPPVWSQLAPTGTAPSPRLAASMAYDPARDRMILFGGSSNDPQGPNISETWELTLGAGAPAWHMLAPVGSPTFFYAGSTMVYDSARDRMLVIGANPSAETWALTLTGPPVWTQLNPAGLPPAALDAAGIYDPVRDRVVLYGGSGNPSPRPSVLTFQGGGAWTKVTPSLFTPWPDIRAGSRAAYDPVRDRMIVQGGIGFADTWALSLADSFAWSLVSSSSGNHVGDHAMCYVPERDEIVTFGGLSRSGSYDVHDVVHALNLASSIWSISSLERFDESLVTDTRRGRVLVFGGNDGVALANDVWEWSPAGQGWWTQIVPSQTPPQPRYHHAAVYDSIGDRMLVFGGAAPDSLNDVWELRFDGVPAWAPLSPSGTAPSPRSGHTAVMDPTRQRMVVYGGASHRNGVMTLNDVWALMLDGSPEWVPLAPAGASAPYWVGAVACYDRPRDRMVVVRDCNKAATLRFDPLEWVTTDSGYAPSEYDGRPSGYLDSGRDRIVLSQSDYNGNVTLWSHDLAANMCSSLVLSGTPPTARIDAALAGAPGQDRALLFGGYQDGAYGNYLTAIDPRALEWSAAASGVEDLPRSAAAPSVRILPTVSRSTQWIDVQLAAGRSSTLTLFDVNGRRVRRWRVADGGPRRWAWDGRDESGSVVAAGVYFARLDCGADQVTGRLVRLR